MRKFHVFAVLGAFLALPGCGNVQGQDLLASPVPMLEDPGGTNIAMPAEIEAVSAGSYLAPSAARDGGIRLVIDESAQAPFYVPSAPAPSAAPQAFYNTAAPAQQGIGRITWLSTAAPLPTAEPFVQETLSVRAPDALLAPQPSPGPVYDIVCFFGQSNMNAWAMTNSLLPELNFDGGVDAYGADIDADIVSWAVNATKVGVPIEDGTAYLYMALGDREHAGAHFQEIRDEFLYINGCGFLSSGWTDDNTYGRSYGGLMYDPVSGELSQYISGGSGYVSCQVSGNQTMVPEFCREYYSLTGHVPIAVLCAVGGAPIECFLPSDDPDNYYVSNTLPHNYIYEGLAANVNGARELAREQGLSVNGVYWVCFQGEGNLGTDAGTYFGRFSRVRENLISDIGADGGVIALTGGTPFRGGSEYDKILEINSAQQALAGAYGDIAIGSEFSFLHWLPSEDFYYSETFPGGAWLGPDGAKIDYQDAVARLGFIADTQDDFFDTGQNNGIHLNSLALSQVGRECAQALAGLVSGTD